MQAQGRSDYGYIHVHCCLSTVLQIITFCTLTYHLNSFDMSMRLSNLWNKTVIDLMFIEYFNSRSDNPSINSYKHVVDYQQWQHLTYG